MRILGVVLVLIGLIGLAFGGIPYKHTENVAQIGDFKMKVTEQKHWNLPPLVSGFAILVGTALFFSARKPNA
ncbi:MAG: hypothetical protein HY076_07785 [Candidatus Eisenbacteria bacterium]|uniref:DUF3185 domain-containing protein n=1 Tax=Eiseniibacteriota bacterium TaxID=2212470 RepID=A0A9D6QPQ0_UNCEI|nr:hypothetical protein [Candidatus Eisenbacteria bacterium]MBI3540159.1 hypothetical protein [Candidatus Eisenbacteria bacterium]